MSSVVDDRDVAQAHQHALPCDSRSKGGLLCVPMKDLETLYRDIRQTEHRQGRCTRPSHSLSRRYQTDVIRIGCTVVKPRYGAGCTIAWRQFTSCRSRLDAMLSRTIDRLVKVGSVGRGSPAAEYATQSRSFLNPYPKGRRRTTRSRRDLGNRPDQLLIVG